MKEKFFIHQDEKEKWGLIDENGKWVIEPTFEYISEFREGIACITKNGRAGFMK